MKKLGLLVMPLMAISLLSSCGCSKEPAKVSYTLTYTYDNGSTDKYVETYDKDKKTEKPTWKPEYANHTFDGWFTKSGKEGDSFTFGNVLTDNTVVYAHWSEKPAPAVSHKLIYHYDNETTETYTETYVGDAETVEPTWTPSYDGHTFKGWYYNEQGKLPDEPFTFGNPLELEETEIHAHWDNITFKITFINKGDPDKEIKDIKPGDKVAENIIPIPSPREGSTFIGWCTDRRGALPFDFEKIRIYQNYTLFSGWKEDEPTPEVVHKLIYNFDNGTSKTYTEEYVGDAETVEPTWTPSYDGHTFKGWYENKQDEGTDKIFTFGDPLELEETEIHAHWDNIIPTTYTVTFDPNGGALDEETDAKESINNILYGTAWKNIPDIDKQTATKEGSYTFEGWGLTPNTPDVIGNEYTITKSFTVYAVYTYHATTTASVKLSNDSNNCYLYYENDKYYAGSPVEIPAGIDVTMTIGTVDGYLPVFKENLTFTGQHSGEFNSITHEVIVNVAASATCTISASTTLPKENLDAYSWSEISQLSKMGLAEDLFEVGADTKQVEVNGQSHTVRIIGFNQDVDKDGNKIGITFEFANLICDSSGYSLATQWNDTNDIDDDTGSANHDYLNSSIRKALNGKGDGHILWAQKGNEYWSNEEGGPYTNKSVLDMLPSSGDIEHPDLKEVLVAPQKTASCYKNGEWADKPIVNDDGEYDKLFLLSPDEFGWKSSREGAYTYYQEPTSSQLNLLRIKKQIKEDILKTYFPIPSDAGQECKEIILNYAGLNNYSETTPGGGDNWLRTVWPESNTNTWITEYYGQLNAAHVFSCAHAVAPAFCI